MFLDGFGPQILAGTLVTLKLALGSLLGAVLIGLLGASAKLAANARCAPWPAAIRR
ncbi:histidine transport system permease [Pseudomonas aeruginosa]|nr:histidine transport system permease [Pseudomonas aeruginosa]